MNPISMPATKNPRSIAPECHKTITKILSLNGPTTASKLEKEFSKTMVCSIDSMAALCGCKTYIEFLQEFPDLRLTRSAGGELIVELIKLPNQTGSRPEVSSGKLQSVAATKSPYVGTSFDGVKLDHSSSSSSRVPIVRRYFFMQSYSMFHIKQFLLCVSPKIQKCSLTAKNTSKKSFFRTMANALMLSWTETTGKKSNNPSIRSSKRVGFKVILNSCNK